MQGNAKKCEGDVWTCVESARKMQENARVKREGVNARECRGMRWSQCEVQGEYRVLQGNARRTHGSGCKVQGNAGECKGMQGEHMQVFKVPGEYREMQGNARGMHGSGCKVPGECGRTHGSGLKVAGECRGMPRECMGGCVKC